MGVKLLTEHHLEFLSLKGGYTGSSESTLVKMPHCWKSRVAAHMLSLFLLQLRVLVSSVHSTRIVSSTKLITPPTVPV